jgi:hypothetical protein
MGSTLVLYVQLSCKAMDAEAVALGMTAEAFSLVFMLW